MVSNLDESAFKIFACGYLKGQIKPKKVIAENVLIQAHLLIKITIFSDKIAVKINKNY